MTNQPNRREALTFISAATLVSCAAPRQTRVHDVNANPVFSHGVASGDPDETSIVLWTRITSSRQSEEVFWEVSQNRTFSKIVSSGSKIASPDRDYTVKVIAENLKPGQSYYYRFKTAAITSPLGRTKTLPNENVETLGIALASCSNYAFGFFNAYDAIAKDKAIDFVLHTGDYIYEYGAKEWGHETAEAIGRVHKPAHEIVSLADYRIRHGQYKTDAGSRAMHAAHPMLCLWDDHESTNNPWLGGAHNHNPEKGEGKWATRREAAIQAYYEWMPIRDPKPGQDPRDFWRDYNFGNLATLVTLETRHTARAKQIDYSVHQKTVKTHNDAKQLKTKVIGAPGRQMISEAMENALSKALSRSTRKGQPWRLIGNASPIAKMLVPDVMESGVLKNAKPAQLKTSAAKSLIWKGKYNLPFYTDTWDGYPWAREKLYDMCDNLGVNDLLFLTGDSHSFWMNQLADNQGKAMGLEIGTAGISSPGDFVESGWDDDTANKLDRLFETQLDEVIWTDNFHQGYVRLKFSTKHADIDFVAMSTVLSSNYKTKTIKQTRVSREGHTIKYKDG